MPEEEVLGRLDALTLLVSGAGAGAGAGALRNFSNYKEMIAASWLLVYLLRPLLCIAHLSAAFSPNVRVPRPREHSRVPRVALSARAC